MLLRNLALTTIVALAAGHAASTPRAARAAGPDNSVEWGGVSHVAHQDRRPLCPISRQSFQIRFQALAGDLTAARVHFDDGATVSWLDAVVVGSRGPYDVWAAQAPASSTNTVSYYLELTDGTDTDYCSASGLSDGPPTDGGYAVNFSTLSHAPLGATKATTGVVFKVWSPTRTTAHVRGQFNGWGTGNPMARVGEYFVAHVTNAADLHPYKYFFNNSVWNSDPRARGLDPTQSLNAQIQNPFRHTWLNPGFETPPLEEMVIYQLHVGTFAGRNDPLGTPTHPAKFTDVAARAGHLEELGINAVLLNPVTEFPGDLSAGYNPITQWSPEWRYGTPDQFKQMVDALHARGIAVLLDIVWNHFSATDNYLWNYDGTQIYFDTPAVETPWGSQADFDSDEVRDYFVHSALHWLEEYRVDGFRMDATGYMDQGAHAASGYTLMQRLNDAVDNRWRDKVVIAEELPDDAWITRPTNLGGAGFDSQYHDAFTDRLREEISDAGFGGAEMWKIRNIINGSGQYLNGRSVTNYFELHDEVWPENGGQRMVKSIDTTFPHDDVFARGRTMLAQGLVLLAPGVPAIHQGSEWLEDTGFGTDAANRIDWSKKATYAGVFEYYRRLIALRTSHPALRADASHLVFHLNEAADVLAFDRNDGGDSLLVVVANFSNTDYSSYRIGVPREGAWREALNSQHPDFSGTGPVNPGTLATEAVAADGRAQSLRLAVPAMGILALRWMPDAIGVPDGPPSDAPPVGLLGVFPNPAASRATVSFRLAEASNVRIDVLDLNGRSVVTLLDDMRPAGEHRMVWNGRSANETRVRGGIYFLRLDAGGVAETRRVVLLPAR